MTCESYQDFNFKADTLALIGTMNGIVTEYMRQGYTLTVRQLYYQLVARAVVENTERSYKRITGVVNDARLAGMMDWDAIEDRTRSFIRRTRWDSASQILDASARSFHMDHWSNQQTRLFVIVEKEALAGVLESVCYQWDVPLLAARGYPSGTVLREFVERDLVDLPGQEQDAVILHLGDHDPSGIDMTRDLTGRIEMFMRDDAHAIGLTRIALNMDQIQAQRPPPNPAKTTDSRFADYMKKHGSESWELDALKPDYLASLVERNVRHYIDEDKWIERRDEIEEIRSKISAVAKRFKNEGV